MTICTNWRVNFVAEEKAPPVALASACSRSTRSLSADHRRVNAGTMPSAVATSAFLTAEST